MDAQVGPERAGRTARFRRTVQDMPFGKFNAGRIDWFASKQLAPSSNGINDHPQQLFHQTIVIALPGALVKSATGCAFDQCVSGAFSRETSISRRLKNSRRPPALSSASVEHFAVQR